MKIYFLSSRPCALFLDGEFAGKTDLFERFADVSPKDNVFVRFVPEGALPVSFFLTERLRFSPPAAKCTFSATGSPCMPAISRPPTFP